MLVKIAILPFSCLLALQVLSLERTNCYVSLLLLPFMENEKQARETNMECQQEKQARKASKKNKTKQDKPHCGRKTCGAGILGLTAGPYSELALEALGISIPFPIWTTNGALPNGSTAAQSAARSQQGALLPSSWCKEHPRPLEEAPSLAFLPSIFTIFLN